MRAMVANSASQGDLRVACLGGESRGTLSETSSIDGDESDLVGIGDLISGIGIGLGTCTGGGNT